MSEDIKPYGPLVYPASAGRQYVEIRAEFNAYSPNGRELADELYSRMKHKWACGERVYFKQDNGPEVSGYVKDIRVENHPGYIVVSVEII